MRLVRNSGCDRVIDLIRPLLSPGSQMDMLSPTLSLFAFAEIRSVLAKIHRCRVLIPKIEGGLASLGSPADRGARRGAGRGRAHARGLAAACAA